MPVTLRPMTAEEFAAYAKTSAREYAAENVRAGRWPAEGADERAAAEYAQLLPQGPQTPGHAVQVVLDGTGQRVGVLWYAERGGEWFIYDFSISPPFQGQGYGREALATLQALAQAQGVGRIGLHVFGHNGRARELYRRAGFEEVSVLMRLDVPSTSLN